MTTIEFRDGEKDVPDHVAVMMKGLETHTMTYEQAVRASEQKMVKDRLNYEMNSLVADHFREMR
jgi:hypothetical protein